MGSVAQRKKQTAVPTGRAQPIRVGDEGTEAGSKLPSVVIG